MAGVDGQRALVGRTFIATLIPYLFIWVIYIFCASSDEGRGLECNYRALASVT